ncbi:MAG TPA: hypothetical protein VHQ70_03785, partial [Syntrophomonadaceae bacterium]|nr:hypothetical protein [Syntrophomonadaceae bacterium]
QNNGIEVIRMGLHPSEDLRSQGTIAAGPFHPSFGELVEQQIFKEQAEMAAGKLIADYIPENPITFYVNTRDISKLIGNRKENIKFLKMSLACEKIDIKAIPGDERNWVGVSCGKVCQPAVVVNRTEFIRDYLNK